MIVQDVVDGFLVRAAPMAEARPKLRVMEVYDREGYFSSISSRECLFRYSTEDETPMLSFHSTWHEDWDFSPEVVRAWSRTTSTHTNGHCNIVNTRFDTMSSFLGLQIEMGINGRGLGTKIVDPFTSELMPFDIAIQLP